MVWSGGDAAEGQRAGPASTQCQQCTYLPAAQMYYPVQINQFPLQRVKSQKKCPLKTPKVHNLQLTWIQPAVCASLLKPTKCTFSTDVALPKQPLVRSQLNLRLENAIRDGRGK